MRITEPRLRQVAAAILRHGGSADAEATTVADHLVRSNLAGHDSHGVGMLPYYVRFLEQGLLRPNVPATLVKDDGAILMFDGARGYGQRVAREAMAAAIERCRQTGVTLMTVRSAHHMGRIGTYGEQALDAGFVSLHFVNVQDHPPLVAPFRGSEARFGTNPICIAVPGTSTTEPVLLDMATSLIALGKVRVAMNKGESVPVGHLIDSAGQSTTDPHVMFAASERGALLPLAEHKGYGLMLACELLAGVLSGGGTIQPATARKGAIVNNMLTFVIDPGRLVDMAWMAREVDAMIAYSRSTPPADPTEPVLVAGEPERRHATERRAAGIPIDPTTWRELEEAALAVGLSATELRGLAQP